MNNLGSMYERGLGVAKNYDEARHWYRKAAEAGEAIAMYNLGSIYEQGIGVAVNYDEALRWYRKAAEAGDEDATNRLKELGENP